MVEHRSGSRTDSTGESVWYSWGVSVGSWLVARATIGQRFSRFRDTKQVSASISASDRVAVLGPEGAPKGSGKPSMAMVETQAREA